MQYSSAFVLQILILLVIISLSALTTSAVPMKPKQQQQHELQGNLSEESSQPQPPQRSRRSIAKTFISAFPDDMRRKWRDIRKRKSLTVAQMAIAAVRDGRQFGRDSLFSPSVAQTFITAIRQGSPSHDEEEGDASNAALHTGHQKLRLLLLRSICRRLRESGNPDADRFCYFSGVEND